MAVVTVSEPYYTVGGQKVPASKATPAQKEQAISEMRASTKFTTTPASTSKGVTVSEAYYTVGGVKVPASQATEMQKQQAIAETRPAAAKAMQEAQPKTSGVTVSEPYYTIEGRRVPASTATAEQVSAAERDVATKLGVPEKTVMERYGIVEFAGEQQPFPIGEGAPPSSTLVAAPVSVTTTELAQRGAESAMKWYQERGQEVYLFKEGAVPSDVVPLQTIRSTTQTTTLKPSGEYVTYSISPSAFTVQEPGKAAVTTFAPPGQEYNIYAFLGEAQKQGASIKYEGQGAIVTVPTMVTEIGTQIGGKEGYVIARKATEGEQWVQLGRERMKGVEEYPGIKQLSQVAAGIIAVPETLTKSAVATSRSPVIGYGLQTLGGVATAATAGAVSVLKIPEFGVKVSVGLGTMAQQAITSPESFKQQAKVTAEVAPAGVAVVGGLVATQAVESVKADPRNVLYAGAYLAGAYAGTTVAIEAAQKGATYVSGGVKTLGRSITEITGRSAVGETTGITSAKGVTSAGFQKVPYELSGTVKSVPSGVPGMSAYETTGVIKGEYVGLFRSTSKFIEFREQGLISGLKPGAEGGIELGTAAALPPRFGATGVSPGGLYYVSLSKGMQTVPTESVYIPFMKGALSKELSSLPAIEVGAYTYPATTTYFSYGIQAGMTGQRSTISELGTILDTLPAASTSGGAGGAATMLGGGGGGTVTQLTTQLQTFVPPPSIGAQATQQLITFAAAEQAKELSTYAAGGSALTKTLSMTQPTTVEAAGVSTSTLMITEPVRTFRPSTTTAAPLPSGLTMQKVMGGTVTRAAEETISLQAVSTTRAEQKLISQPQMTQQLTEGVTIPALESLGMETTEEISRTMTLEGVTTMQMTETIPVTEQVTETMFMQAAPTTALMEPPTIVPPIIPSLDFGGGRAERDMLGTRIKQPRGYQPSLTAIALDIRAKPSKKLLTGLELRPVPPAKKSKKKEPFGGLI